MRLRSWSRITTGAGSASRCGSRRRSRWAWPIISGVWAHCCAKPRPPHRLRRSPLHPISTPDQAVDGSDSLPGEATTGRCNRGRMRPTRVAAVQLNFSHSTRNAAPLSHMPPVPTSMANCHTEKSIVVMKQLPMKPYNRTVRHPRMLRAAALRSARKRSLRTKDVGTFVREMTKCHKSRTLSKEHYQRLVLLTCRASVEQQ